MKKFSRNFSAAENPAGFATTMKKFSTTEEIPIPTRLIDQVIGQDEAVRIVRKAAAQKRNVLMIGTFLFCAAAFRTMRNEIGRAHV